MRLPKCIFLFLAISGLLPPASWTSPRKRSLFKLYSLISLLVLHTLLLTQVLDLVFNVESQDEFSDNYCITIVVFVTCLKIFNILVRREHIELLVGILQREPFTAITEEEVAIEARFEKIAEWNAIGFSSLLLGCCALICIRSLFTDFGDRKLTFRAWIPYDYSSASVFLLTYLHQCVAATLCCISGASGDSLYSSFLIYISCQFELLEARLRNLKDGKSSMKQCVRHHNRIYEYVRMVNDEFKGVLFVQFCISMSVICFNLYQMAQVSIGDSRFVERVLYAVCTLTQIFYYCWYGNEVKLKSIQLTDMIFRSDWISLNSKGKKCLLIVMKRAVRPVEFSSGYVLSLNLDCFMTLIKTSYSAFNMLQQSRTSLDK